MPLTKHIRLLIYSYIDVEDTLKTISLISRNERKALMDSQLAREGKSILMKIDQFNGYNYDEVLAKKDMLFCLVDFVRIYFSPSTLSANSFYFEQQKLAELIVYLPKRFDDKIRLSISLAEEACLVDAFWNHINYHRPKLIFDELSFEKYA